jgi:alpha-D-xyloside xylohydrolase
MKIFWEQGLVILFSFLMIACSSTGYKKLPDGIIIQPKKTTETDAALVKIQVCSDDIIRVVAAPGKEFSDRPSLIVDKANWAPVKWQLTEKGDTIVITTAQLLVKVSKSSGAVAFFKKNGELLLGESAKGGKVITPAVVMAENTYHIQQLFDSPDDEAFYGLGQHQNGVINYKGHDVDLWQYNIVAAVPFLVSNKHYGILWDNNSRTKFGDIRDFESLEKFKLIDKDGKESGLTAEYFTDPEFKQLLLSQTESRIEHEFDDVNDPFPGGFQKNGNVSIRWSGAIEAAETGVYKFRLYCSGYTKMWLNGELVVDCWRQNWLPWTHLPKLYMEAGKCYPLKIEWIPTGGYIGLKCLSPEDKKYANSLSLYSEVADQIDYYFVYGENPDSIIQGYREITGKAPLMPKWALGLWQCRERYQSQQELINVVKEFRKLQIPLDNIVQDWFYWSEDQWGSHDFDLSRYPDAKGMVRELHENLHTHIMISVWPKFYVGTEHYREFKDKGWLYMRNVEKGQRDWVGPGYVSTFYDPYSEGARELFWQQINEKLFSKGFDAWWLDATEPDIQSNLSQTETILRNGPTALGTTARYLNTYSLMNAKGIYEHQRQTQPDQRVFILTRSAYAGQQRYAAATWSGDIATRWYDLKIQIPAGLNFCLSGIPYWTTDIGGFAVEPRFERKVKPEDLEEWRELNVRWFQFGAFCPLFRVHGQYPYREMFNIAPPENPAYQAMLVCDKLRYRLMPYIYSLAGMVTHQDYTIMRALIMDFGQDQQVLNIADQFMFGPSLLINPVYEYQARSRQVYLPAGAGWYELKTGCFQQGGQTIKADAPLTNIPIFVKAGSIIPIGPKIQFNDDKNADPIRLLIYTGGDGSFRLYEDENINYNYEKGFYSEIPFSYNEKDGTLTIGERKGAFPGMLKERTFEIVKITPVKPCGFDLTAKPDQIVKYDGNELLIKLEN